MNIGAERVELESKAKHTMACIHAGLDSNMVPMVSQIVRIIREISGMAERMSVNDLAESISGEPTTMGRIVSIAGSVGYNASGTEINSLHHAISLIGFERVRSLAISILLFEHAQSERTIAISRELAGAAFLSGIVAGEMAKRVPLLDSELAFICGALRGYGRMLTATFMPAEYLAMLEKPDPHDEECFRESFGLTPIELGQQLLSGMQMPKSILNSFMTLSPLTRENAAGHPATALVATAELGMRTSELLQSRGLTSAKFHSRMELLSRGYDPVFLLTPTAIRELLEHIVCILESFRSRASSYVGAVTLFRRVKQLADERPISAAPEFRPVVLPTPSSQIRVSKPGNLSFDI